MMYFITELCFKRECINVIHLIFSPVICSLVPAAIPNTPFHLKFTKGKGAHSEVIINYEFTLHDVICLMCCSLIGVWYIINKVG